MKNLKFNENDFLLKNDFSNILKGEINRMMLNYFRNQYTVPLNFETFDEEISNLIIKVLDTQDSLKKINKYKQLHENKFTKKVISTNKIYHNKHKKIKNSPKLDSKKYTHKKSKKFSFHIKKFIK